MQPILYLASGSYSRKLLLTQADIPFTVCGQTAHEESVSLEQPLQHAAEEIVRLKIEHAQLPAGIMQGERCYVLVGDTVGQLHDDNSLLAKPLNYEMLCNWLRRFAHGATTGTAVCVDERQWDADAQQWVVLRREYGYAQASYRYVVPEGWVDRYIEAVQRINGVSVYNVGGGVCVEGYGAQFLTDVQGEYTAIVGLPMFVTRELLMKIGFLS